MNGKNLLPYVLLAALGATLLAIGAFVFVDESVKTISGLCYELGAAAASVGIGNVVIRLFINEDGETMRRKEIEVNDERNVRVREKAGSKANFLIVLAISAVIMILGIIGADVGVLLVVSSLLVLELVLVISLTQYYSSRM